MMLQASCPSAASREVLHDWHGSPGGSKGSCDPSTRSYHTCSRPASAEMTLTKNDDERNGREKSRVSPWGPRAPGEGRDRDGVGRAGAWRPRAGGGWGGATSGSSEDPGVSGEQLRRTGLPKTPGAVDSGLGKVRGYRGLRHRDLGGQGPSHCPVPSSPGTRLDASSALAWRPPPGPSPAVSRGSHGRSLEAALLAVGPSPVPPSVNQQPRGAGPETTDGSVRPDGADRGAAARRPGELGAASRCPPPPHMRQGPGTSSSLLWGALPPPGSSGLPEAPRCGSAIPNGRRRPTRDACRGGPSATRRLGPRQTPRTPRSAGRCPACHERTRHGATA